MMAFLFWANHARKMESQTMLGNSTTQQLIKQQVLDLETAINTPDWDKALMELIDSLVQEDLEDVVEGFIQNTIDTGGTLDQAKLGLIKIFWDRTQTPSINPLTQLFFQQCFESIMASVFEMEAPKA